MEWKGKIMSKLLVVDDIQENRYLLQMLLQGYGHEVVTAENGVQALEAARKDKPDLIISDILMPEMDGFELCRRWKRDVTLNKIPFIFYTATYTEPKDEAFALSLGADRFIIKPQEPERLIEIVNGYTKDIASGKVIEAKKIIATEDSLDKQYTKVLSEKLEKKVKELQIEIQNKRLTENELRKSEARFRELIEHLSDIVWRVTPECKFSYISPSLKKMLGFDYVAFLDRDISSLLNHEPLIKAIKKLSRSETVAHIEQLFEFEIRNAQGHQVFLETRIIPLFSHKGELTEIQGITRDVTKIVNAREALHQSEQRFRLAASTVTDLVYEWDLADDSCNWFGDIDCALGYDAGEFKHTLACWLDHVHPDDKEMAIQSIETHRIEPKPIRESYRMRTKDGSWREWDDYAVPQLDEKGKPIRWIGACIDRTEKMMLEKQLNQALKMEAIGHLAGGIAHDFNNLLQIILGYTEISLLNDCERPEDIFELRDSLEQINAAAHKAARMTGQLLTFSRKQVIQPTYLSLNNLVQDLFKILKRLIGADIDVKFFLDEDVGAIYADHGQIDQVIINLCINARDAMPDGGTLVLETRNFKVTEDYQRIYPWAKIGDYAVLSITDNGCGMDKETREQIFEPFFTTKEPGKGTGLGLATVYGIIQKHDGMIYVYSEPGQGTTFKIYFPHVEGGIVPDQIPYEEDIANGHETILLVDDEEMLLDLSSMILEKAGYSVIRAHDGEEALEILQQRKNEIDLTVIDVILPKFSGRIVRERAIQFLPDAKFLFVSGYSYNAVSNQFLQNENLILLSKPFSRVALLQKVREILDGKVKRCV